MKDTEANARPDNFANAPLDEAVERLVRIIRAERPQVIITYGDDSKFYPHPDHVRRARDLGSRVRRGRRPVTAFPDSGEPWQPQKMYYTGWSARRIRALHDAFIARGEESPYAQWFEREGFDEHDDQFTTFVDVGDFLHNRREALLAHRTQVDPTGFWMRLPDDVVREIFPWEEFVLARIARRHRGARGRHRRRPLRRAARAPAPHLMPQYLSQEWLDETRALADGQPERPGASAQMQYVVSGGPDGDVKYYWILEDGKLLESALGDAPTADFTLSLVYADSVKVQQGELDANAAFMQGRMKVAGDMGEVHGAPAADHLARVQVPPGPGPHPHHLLADPPPPPPPALPPTPLPPFVRFAVRVTGFGTNGGRSGGGRRRCTWT